MLWMLIWGMVIIAVPVARTLFGMIVLNKKGRLNSLPFLLLVHARHLIKQVKGNLLITQKSLSSCPASPWNADYACRSPAG